MHDAALPPGVRQELVDALDQPPAGVRDDQLNTLETAVDQMAQERRPARLVLLGALADAEDLAVTLGIHADRHQQRDVAHLGGPGSLHHDAVEEDVRMLALDRPVPPGLDLGVDHLVEVGDRARAHPRAPERLGDVLDPPHRDAGEIHLDQRLLDRALPATVALDDRRLERLAPQLRDLQADLAGSCLQRSLIAAGPRVLPRLAALVASGAAKLVRLGVQHRIQRLLDGPANHLAEVIPDPTLIDLVSGDTTNWPSGDKRN